MKWLRVLPYRLVLSVGTPLYRAVKPRHGTPSEPLCGLDRKSRHPLASALLSTLIARRLAQLGELYAADARFKDPFNEVQGVPAIQGHLFPYVRGLEQPRFVVTRPRGARPAGFLTVGFHCSHSRTLQGRDADGARRSTWCISMSKAWSRCTATTGTPLKSCYEKLPVVGALMRWLKRRAKS